MTEDTKKVLNQLIRDIVKPTPEALYHQLTRLRDEMPPFHELGATSSSRWIGRAIALVGAVDNSTMEAVNLRAYVNHINRHPGNIPAANMIAQIIETVIARVELKLPAEQQGAFIPAGGVFDGYHAVSKAVAAAKKSIFFIDPYGDDTLISDFVPLATEGLPVAVMSDAEHAKPSLKPAAERWIVQWKQQRPLEVRIAPARSLHDRLIVIDHNAAWVVGQSFKDLAKRANTSLVRMDPESGTLKINAHLELWQKAAKLV